MNDTELLKKFKFLEKIDEGARDDLYKDFDIINNRECDLKIYNINRITHQCLVELDEQDSSFIKIIKGKILWKFVNQKT